MSENPVFSYTKRDYEGSRQEGISKIPLLSNGQWTDLNATDPGIVILDYVHALVDMMSYYLDHQALEAFITTAKERANVFRLAKQMSYKIRSAQGAICDVEFGLARPEPDNLYNYTIKIPKYTVVSTLSGIQYLTREDAFLEPDASSVIVTCSQGRLNTYKYQGTGISRYSDVVGAKNQSIRLIDNNIEIDSITIKDNTEKEWTAIDHIVFAEENSRVYEVELNPDNTITIKFGDGLRGKVPSTSDYLTISYITTDAEEGRVSMRSLTYLKSSIYNEYDEEGNPTEDAQYIPFTVDNNNPSSGGSSPQSTQEIRDLAPGVVKAQDRAVTLHDFEYLAKSVDGVLDAKAYDINTAPDICLHHEVKVVITPKEENAGESSVLKNNVYNFLYQRMLPPTNLQVMLPSYINVYVDIKVRKLNITTDSRLKYAVEQTTKDFFKNISSKSFHPSDLLASFYKLEGFRSLNSIDMYTLDSNNKKVIIPIDKEYIIPELSSVRLSTTESGLVVDIVE